MGKHLQTRGSFTAGNVASFDIDGFIVDDNLSFGLIRDYEKTEIVMTTGSGDIFVSKTINFNTSDKIFFTLEYTGGYSSGFTTNLGARSFDINLITTTAKNGQYFIVDFINNRSGAKLNIDGSFQYYLSQNATYIISYSTSNGVIVNMLGKPKAIASDYNVTYMLTPGEYYLSSAYSYSLVNVNEVIKGEQIIIHYTSGSSPNITSVSPIQTQYYSSNIFTIKFEQQFFYGGGQQLFWYKTN